MNDKNPTPMEAVAATEAVGEVFRKSDCCIAEVIENIEKTSPDDDWYSVTFECQQCGNECRCITNPQIASLMTENRELKGAQSA